MATNKLEKIKHELARVRYVRLSKKYRLHLIHFKQHYSALQNNRDFWILKRGRQADNEDTIFLIVSCECTWISVILVEKRGSRRHFTMS